MFHIQPSILQLYGHIHNQAGVRNQEIPDYLRL